MTKINQNNWKPSYFYIRHVTVGQLLPIIKEAFLVFFWSFIVFGLIGYFSVDDWNTNAYEQSKISWQKDFLGIDKYIWVFIFLAAISWFIKDKERTFKIPRFDKVEWFLLNLCMIIFACIFSYLSWWSATMAFIAMMAIGRAYEDMVFIGKRNYEEENFND